ncbi:YlbL family protein [Streptacidiphilus fuscans]|uniref:PDZ domain-containing protein n=1 Tax=Streptacidiphilus fuscans TaxID=2789292 RepID=A0A931FBM2_9ACTN|nr:PDZ domain-containing protein [Streptacidiphilus fuscans]MBF9067593.1 PDZ domain-containing protein [Streptacidiphilus fuscans]
MPRRSATMLASTLLLIALFCVALLVPAPYAEMSPGPTYNTLGDQNGKAVIVINGQKTYPTTGNLNMTTVEVSSADYQPNLISALAGWFDSSMAIVPHDTLYPQGQTEQQAQQQNAEEFSSSQDSARTAALTQLGYKVEAEVVVAAVVEGSPSVGKLHAGDVIVAVDGTPVTDPNQVGALVTKHQPGQNVVFTVIPAQKSSDVTLTAAQRAAAEQKVTVTTVENTSTKKAMVGIQPDVEHTFPFDVQINLGDVGGPSAGLMFALGIIDKLQPTNLTGGKFVAGTGTIDDQGNVGPIGGISMKMIAARNAGAQYFMTPADNCAEAASATPSGLTLVKETNLNGALAALADIRSGDVSALPSCTSK